MRRETLAVVLVALIAGVVAGGLTGAVLDNDSAPTPPSATAARVPQAIATSAASKSPEAIYRQDARGVVVITDKQTQNVQPTMSGPGGKQQVGVLGSGFVIDRRGDIVTNDHVVQGATAIRVAFSGNASYPARIIGTDPSSDLAVIRVSAPPASLHPLMFGDSANVEVGDSVYAIGNPFGLERTMTAGIISALGRDITAPNGLTIANAVQTDAPINHGNSGGPLLDRLGRVIAVNSQIEGGTVDANVGIGFAIPSATARSVTDQLISSGHVRHAFLGVATVTIDSNVQKLTPGLPKQGALVASVVKGGPAAKAGLEPARLRVAANGARELAGGDVIVAFDGKPVASAARLSELVALQKPGDTVQLEIVRGGARRTAAVTLGNAPS